MTADNPPPSASQLHQQGQPLQNQQQVQLPPPYYPSQSAPPPPLPQFTRPKDAIALADTDRIRLINTNPARTAMIRQVIQQHWKDGIQKERVVVDQISFEFKLKGGPWHCMIADAVRSRRLVLAMIRAMAQIGWKLCASIDVVTLGPNADTMYFELDPIAGMNPDAPMNFAVDMFAISFHNPDTIRVIDAPMLAVDWVRHAIQTRWSKGITKEDRFYDAIQFKVKGTPMYTGSHEIEWKLLLLQILANLSPLGYKLYGSVDVQSSNGSDMWVFRRIDVAWS
ncbi:hypothetical protein BGZ83_012072 [Gryganskiella cystojenkinii]|nr:hypothetical protein BGZ83_012072 [Gryganskiella cystojenkinii]